MELGQEDIKDFVRRHQVYWESHPITVMKGANRLQVGFELELSAVAENHSPGLTPGTLACQKLFDGLRQVAEQLAAVQRPEVRIEIGPYDHSLRLSVSQGSPEVLLKLQILHREDCFQPIDSAQLEILADAERVLKSFGVQSGRRAGQ